MLRREHSVNVFALIDNWKPYYFFNITVATIVGGLMGQPCLKCFVCSNLVAADLPIEEPQQRFFQSTTTAFLIPGRTQPQCVCGSGPIPTNNSQTGMDYLRIQLRA